MNDSTNFNLILTLKHQLTVTQIYWALLDIVFTEGGNRGLSFLLNFPHFLPFLNFCLIFWYWWPVFQNSELLFFSFQNFTELRSMEYMDWLVEARNGKFLISLIVWVRLPTPTLKQFEIVKMDASVWPMSMSKLNLMFFNARAIDPIYMVSLFSTFAAFWECLVFLPHPTSIISAFLLSL